MNQVDKLVEIINKAEVDAAKEREAADLEAKKREKLERRRAPPPMMSGDDDEKKETASVTASVVSEMSALTVTPASPTGTVATIGTVDTMGTVTSVSTTSTKSTDDSKDDAKDGDENNLQQRPAVPAVQSLAHRRNVEQPNVDLGIRINEKSIVTDCLELKYPAFTYMAGGSRRGETRVKRVNLGGPEFKWGGREGTKGFLEDVRPIERWVIVDDVNSRGAGNKVYQHWEAYVGMRGFDFNQGPIREPECRSIDFRAGDREFMRIAQEQYQLIFVVLPDGVQGSEIKAKFTKALQTQKMTGGSKGRGAIVCTDCNLYIVCVR